MPKILPTFAAIAIIGVCIAINTARYPIVWEMVGPNGQLAFSEKTEPSTTPSQNPVQPPETMCEKSVEIAKASPPKQADVTPPAPKAVPVALPKEEPAVVDNKQDADKAISTEPSAGIGFSGEEEKLVEPPRRLVPVAKGNFLADAVGNMLEIRRLPPLDAENSGSSNICAADRSSSTITIYPSTGQ